jgi:hypothetical protein
MTCMKFCCHYSDGRGPHGASDRVIKPDPVEQKLVSRMFLYNYLGKLTYCLSISGSLRRKYETSEPMDGLKFSYIRESPILQSCQDSMIRRRNLFKQLLSRWRSCLPYTIAPDHGFAFGP